MNELRDAISEIVSDHIQKTTSIVYGKVMDYDWRAKTCIVDFSNTSGGRLVRSYNLTIPDGVSANTVAKGSVAIVSIPQGNMNYATLLGIRPPTDSYTLDTKIREVPRNDTNRY